MALLICFSSCFIMWLIDLFCSSSDLGFLISGSLGNWGDGKELNVLNLMSCVVLVYITEAIVVLIWIGRRIFSFLILIFHVRLEILIYFYFFGNKMVHEYLSLILRSIFDWLLLKGSEVSHGSVDLFFIQVLWCEWLICCVVMWSFLCCLVAMENLDGRKELNFWI